MLTEIVSIINKFIPDKSKADEMASQVEKAYTESLNKAVEADLELRLAEIKSDAWLQSRWRPLSALIVFSALLIRFPLYHLLLLIVGLFNMNVYLPELEPLPMEFYGMATAFISIYAYGRSVEKRYRR